MIKTCLSNMREANRLAAIQKITKEVGVPTSIREYAYDNDKFNFWVGNQELYGTVYHGELKIEWSKTVGGQKQLTLF
ncbi:hypothetical protein [Brochothrix thermosphacta]|uniref:hypothetical protein n=2 Tax=Brochothrix thermosphacta TaxID=2756 RepID=UPI0003E87607|nr:hypothetical protein [Brochothrix thermosphacta]EUJ38183.1 hypothetical protein BTHER_02370 [Brochothrix thermosphacta DSM 20171 = FSL F6-1036]